MSRTRIIKGPCYNAELEALRYVARHTSIPVPKVIATHTYEGDLYIELEYVRGTNVAEAWYYGHLSAQQKKDVMPR